VSWLHLIPREFLSSIRIEDSSLRIFRCSRVPYCPNLPSRIRRSICRIKIPLRNRGITNADILFIGIEIRDVPQRVRPGGAPNPNVPSVGAQSIGRDLNAASPRLEQPGCKPEGSPEGELLGIFRGVEAIACP